MKAREIYEKALVLIGEKSASGDEWQYDTAAFEQNAPYLINLLSAACDELDCCIKGHNFTSDGHLPFQIKSLDDEMPLHTYICLGVLPYGLAQLFLIGEDADRAAYFYNLYMRESNALRYRFRPTNRHPLREVY